MKRDSVPCQGNNRALFYIDGSGNAVATTYPQPITHTPTVDSIYPACGCELYSIPIAITGTYLSNVTTVRIGSRDMTITGGQGGNTLEAVVTAGMARGTYDVVVSTSEGTSATGPQSKFTVVQKNSGNIDGDSDRDSNDVSLGLRIDLGAPISYANNNTPHTASQSEYAIADVNVDGNVDAGDAVLIAQMARSGNGSGLSKVRTFAGLCLLPLVLCIPQLNKRKELCKVNISKIAGIIVLVGLLIISGCGGGGGGGSAGGGGNGSSSSMVTPSPNPSPSSQTAISIPSGIPCSAGGQVTVPLIITGGSGIAGYDITLSFNLVLLAPVSVQRTAYSNTFVLESTISHNPQSPVKIALANASPITVSQDTIICVILRV